MPAAANAADRLRRAQRRAGMKVPCAVVGAECPWPGIRDQASASCAASSPSACCARRANSVFGRSPRPLREAAADAPVGTDIRATSPLGRHAVHDQADANRADCLSADRRGARGRGHHRGDVKPCAGRRRFRLRSMHAATSCWMRPQACPATGPHPARRERHGRAAMVDWMASPAQRIRRSALVDITNYVMLESASRCMPRQRQAAGRHPRACRARASRCCCSTADRDACGRQVG